MGIRAGPSRSEGAELPRKELTRIQQAESECGQLPVYPVEKIPEVLETSTLRENMVYGPRGDLEVLYKAIPTHIGTQTEWQVSFTSGFIKDLAHIGDKKKEGRILGAIVELVQEPTEPRGDTLKPLTGPLKGKWRFRIGDYRLVYFPDVLKRVVYLLLIDTRGDIYDR